MNEKQSKYILLLKATEDKRLRYISARRLADLFPDMSFAQWKVKVDVGEPIILMRSDNLLEIDSLKQKLADVAELVEIAEQKSIGGAKVF